MNGFFILYTDGVGGSFNEYCFNLERVTQFIKNLDSKYRVTDITKAQDNCYIIYTNGRGGCFSEYCKDTDSMTKFIRSLDITYTITDIVKANR